MTRSHFLIIGHALHKVDGDKLLSYAPYVREMNLWLKFAGQVTVVAPLSEDNVNALDLSYEHENITLTRIPSVNLINIKGILHSLIVLPAIFYIIFREMGKATHIHLRCPGNIGLIGCFVQIFFPWKKKTAKYAGNWDWSSQQPWSYRLQQLILRNRFLTHNMQTLVYGEWPDCIKNIKPFFTASYSESDKLPVDSDLKANQLTDIIRLAFVGTLTANKRPLFCIEVAKLLVSEGLNIKLELCGDGAQRELLGQYVTDNKLTGSVMFHGNLSGEAVKHVLQNSHFLLFASQSEGWPKAVAEAMWWGCVPITTAVSCVPQMLGGGRRGSLIEADVKMASRAIRQYLDNPHLYIQHSQNAMEWSRQYTLERFNSEIGKLI